ncbi:MAG: 30S ribosomal protein S4e [Candidatus Aenigmatarchaeota archaeon]
MKKMKRLATPKFWKIPKKVGKWVVSPIPGPHKKAECMPLLLIVRDLLKLCETGTETKKMIKAGEVLVDGRKRKEHSFPVGLMDVISIPRIRKNYRVIPSKKGLEIVEISEEEANKKICKIKNKTILKGGKIQLNLHDGRNLIVDKDFYKTGDSLLIELPSQKILDHIKLDKGNLCLIISGKNSGKIGKIEEVVKRKSMKETTKVICNVDEEKIEVTKDFLIPIGKDSPYLRW